MGLRDAPLAVPDQWDPLEVAVPAVFLVAWPVCSVLSLRAAIRLLSSLVFCSRSAAWPSSSAIVLA